MGRDIFSKVFIPRDNTFLESIGVTILKIKKKNRHNIHRSCDRDEFQGFFPGLKYRPGISEPHYQNDSEKEKENNSRENLLQEEDE